MSAHEVICVAVGSIGQFGQLFDHQFSSERILFREIDVGSTTFADLPLDNVLAKLFFRLRPAQISQILRR